MAKPRTPAQERKRIAKLEARSIERQYREPKPERLPPPITMPVIASKPMTDTDVGLPENPGAQMKAEAALRLAHGAWLRERDIARRKAETDQVDHQVVHVEVEDESLHLDHVTLKRIGDELQRIADRPPAKWRNPYPLNG